MQAVIIADNSFATRERAMLSRLEVGLADEGVRVVHAVPATRPFSDGEHVGIQSQIVRDAPTGLPFTLRRRAVDLVRAIEASADEPTPIDVVHAFGAGSWAVATEIARLENASLLIELWRPSLVPPAAALLAAATRAGRSNPPEFIVSEPAVAAALRKRVPQAKAYSAPWGVHAPPSARSPRPADRPLAVAMLCDTGDPRCSAAALAGLVQAVSRRGAGSQSAREPLIFACIDDTTSAREAALWAAARKLKLIDRFSIVPEMESRREPILQMDLLLLPEAGGRQRTLSLEAMAAGVPIIARADPFLETLNDGHTARLVPADTADAWATAISSIVANPTAEADLINAAHEHVRSNRSAATHVADVLRAYQQAADVPMAAG